MSSIGDALTRARSGWSRMAPAGAWTAICDGSALLLDTRTAAQREHGTNLPGAIVIDRTVLEWRLDPTVDTCIPEARTRPRLIVICRQGYSSSFAARSLRDLGLDATDVIRGVEGWSAAGLPFTAEAADVRE